MDTLKYRANKKSDYILLRSEQVIWRSFDYSEISLTDSSSLARL